MPLPFRSPPNNLCVLRLSAVGDVCHTLAVVRHIQLHWPTTKITWIVGKLEASLVGDIPGIEFIIFDKANGWRAYRELQKEMRGRCFDALLHMQMSMRASLCSLFISSPIKLGFDRARAKDYQWLFTNKKIAPHANQHVLDSLFGFAEALGVPGKTLCWDIPIPAQAREFVEHHIPGDKPVLVISPCSSMAYRNWNISGYAQIADYAKEKYGLQVVLTGGPSALEKQYAQDIISAADDQLINLVGETSLKQLLAILDRAVCVISPDSGPAHMATTVGTPVIGLYACTNPDRARPYLSVDWVVNKYDEAVQDKYGKPAAELPWGIRVKDPGTMDRISVNDVADVLDRLLGEVSRE
jgi:heptosyltransferase I